MNRANFIYRAAFIAVGMVSSLRAEPIHLIAIGRFDTGTIGGGAAEIVTYHHPSQRLFSVNTVDRSIDIISIADPTHPTRVGRVPLAGYGSLPTSVVARDDVLAAAVLGSNPAGAGQAVFFTPDGRLLGAVRVGDHPDMLSFSPNGRYLVVANEGEPSADGQQDGQGSVSVISLPSSVGSSEAVAEIEVRDADFRAWNDRELPKGVHRVQRDIPLSQDLEPEGIAISDDSRTAFVSLQENNAVAVVDLGTAQVTRLLGLGLKDHNQTGNELDLSGAGRLDQIRACPVHGIFQPDNVAWFRAGSEAFLALANEGDARGNEAFSEEVKLSDATLDAEHFPQAAELQDPARYGELIVSRTGDLDGDGDLDELLTFGGRSLSILTAEGAPVYESGNLIEKSVGARTLRQRQANPDAPATPPQKKGPEPEGLAIGRLGKRTYVFVGLERDGGIMTWDVTQPKAAELVDYMHPSEQRDAPPGTASDVAPEGLYFISAEQSPSQEPLLAVANEVSGSVTLYAIRPGKRPGSP